MRKGFSGIALIVVVMSIFMGSMLSRVSAQSLDDQKMMGQTADSLKKDSAKVTKPLESYFFDDSIRKMPNFVWFANLSSNNITQSTIDTLISTMKFDYPYLNVGLGDAHMGQLGGPSIPLNYAARADYRNFEFAQAFNAYYYTPQTAPHYNVKRPFTQLNYISSGQKRFLEENFGIIHAQNISPSSGFNISYKSRGAKGIYDHQDARDKNLSTAFSHTGKRYTLHAGYIYNLAKLNENGGITDDGFIRDTIFEEPGTIPVFLEDARTQIKNNSFYIVQSYGIPMSEVTEEDFSIADKTSLFIGHSLEYQKWNKVYTDSRLMSDDSFYDNWFIDPSATRDSITESLLSNKLFVQLQPWGRDAVIGTVDAGIGIDMHKYYQFQMGDYLTGNLDGDTKSSAYLYGDLSGKFKKYLNWRGGASFHPVGYRQGDLNIHGDISISAYLKNKPITLTGGFFFENREPGYWSQQLFSNHYIWSNSFNKETETQFNVALKVPLVDLELGLTQSLFTNKVYYNSESLPTQSDGAISLTAMYAQKDFCISRFHLDHRVLLQWSTAQEVVPVPLASAYLSYYYEFDVVKDVLKVQVGLDGRYNTEYYAFGYNPALAQFYNQREQEIGNYLLVDAFLSAKWKRMRILLKYQHLNEDQFGTRNYFTLLHYPQNRPVLKFGISWTFYD